MRQELNDQPAVVKIYNSAHNRKARGFSLWGIKQLCCKLSIPQLIFRNSTAYEKIHYYSYILTDPVLSFSYIKNQKTASASFDRFVKYPPKCNWAVYILDT